MPPKKKGGALPRGGGQNKSIAPTTKNNNKDNKRASPTTRPPPKAGFRRSERIRKRTLNEAPDLSANNGTAPGVRLGRSGEGSRSGISQSSQIKDRQKSQLYTKLSSWLDEVRLSAVEGAEAYDPSQSGLDDNGMAPRSVHSQLSLATSEYPSTIVPPRGKPKKVSEESLRTRRVVVGQPTKDKWTTEFRSFLVEKPIEIPFEQTGKLQDSLRDFLRKVDQAPDEENSYDAIEQLCDEISEWKAAMRLAAITNQQFDGDLEHCKYPSNEAVFQRTVMMSIIDRCHLKDVFDFNCEGHWSLQGTCPLPSTNGPGDIITGPKPDLAIFFRFGSLVGMDPVSGSVAIPDALKSCINPDNHTLRCFPFIFIEAKKGFETIEPAALANVHSASQALFNIYAWMNKARHDEVFFQDVRLFSIAINAEKVIVRVHRAKPVNNGDDTGLIFTYDDLYPKSKFHYTRDEVCTLIHNILIEYAETKLLGILKRTVETVLKEYKQDLKRKNDATILGRPAKRVTSSQIQPQATQNLFMDASTSLGVSQIEIEDS